MRGLDPRIHDESRHGKSYDRGVARSLKDCRVKPGNDRVESEPHPARRFPARHPPHVSGEGSAAHLHGVSFFISSEVILPVMVKSG